MGKFRAAISKLFSGDDGQSFLWNPIGGVLGRNKKALLNEYRNLVYACVSTIAEDVARYEPIFLYENPKGDDRILENHPFNLLLHNPNPYMTQYDLFESTQSFIELTGEAFWYLELKQNSRQPVGITIIEPHRVQLAIDDATGVLIGYTIQDYAGTQIPCELDEIIHFKMFNPLNKYRGLGTVEAGLLYIDTENEASSYQRNFLQNNGMPVGGVNIKGNISKEKFDEVKKNYKQQFQGPNNAGKILFTRAEGIEFTKFGSSLADLDMSALKNLSQDEVRSMFRIPKAMLGASDENGLGRANVEAIEYSYAKRTIDPKLNRIDDTLRLYCRAAYRDPKLCIEHETQIPADSAAQLQEVNLLVDKVLTRNEARAIYELAPVDGGDDLYTLFNQTPMGQPISAPMKSLGKVTVKTKRPLAIEAPIEKARPTQNKYIAHLNQIHAKTEKRVIAGFEKVLKKQQKKVMGRFHNVHKKNSIYENVGPSPTEDMDAILNELLPEFYSAMEASGQAAISYVATADNQYLMSKTTRDAVAKAEERLIRSFNEQTGQKIQRQLDEGLAKGETVEELAARIESVYGDAIGYRATAIAQSESNRLIVQSTSDAYSQVGVTQVEWVTDGNPCPICESMEGTIQDIGYAFINLGDDLPTTDRSNDYAPIEGGDMHTNCVLPDTVVLSPLTEKIIRGYYSGPIVKFSTASGRELSVTANHMMLTSRGWVMAKNLLDSDAVVSYSGWDERILEINPTDNQRPSTIEEIFTTLVETFGVSSISMPATAKDLKGDGALIEGNIDIVSTDGFLRGDIDSPIKKYLQDFTLDETRIVDPSPLIKRGDLSSMLFALVLASDSGLGGESISSLFASGAFTLDDFLCFFGATEYHTRVHEAFHDRGSRNLITLGETIRGLSDFVSLDGIVDIERLSYSGHVYDLSNQTTVYTSNGLISGNCMCKLVPVDNGTRAYKNIIIEHHHDNEEELETLRKALLEQTEYSQQLEAIAGIDGLIEEN